jgi:hypothetical protein
VELIFQTDRQTVERTEGFAVLGEVIVKFLGVGEGSFEEDFVEAIYLSVLNSAAEKSEQVTMSTDQLMRQRRAMAKRLRDLASLPLSRSRPYNDPTCVSLGDLDLSGREELLDIRPGEISLFLDRG